jgi:hypothetical protein
MGVKSYLGFQEHVLRILSWGINLIIINEM